MMTLCIILLHLLIGMCCWNHNHHHNHNTFFCSAFVTSSTYTTGITGSTFISTRKEITRIFTQRSHRRRTANLLHTTPLSNEKNEDSLPLDPPSSEPPSSQQLRAAVFQPPAPSNSIINNPLGILTQAADCLRVASMHNIDLVLFPELYLTGGVSYSESDGDNVDATADDSQGDGNHAGVSAVHASLDRESYELSIIGNLCAELNVACAMGYAELKHESEIDASIVEVSSVYNSMALFHADGSRAANFRCTISDTDKYLNGNPFVEVMPVNLNLPCRGEESRNNDNQIKVGMAIGNEIFVPEHYRHLARSGAQLLLAASAFHSRCHSHDEHVSSANMEEKCVLTTRAMENGVPILSSNYVGVRGGGCEAGELLFNGSSGIVSSRGKDLVVAPQMEGGDMPCGEGYFLPCETGDLYAADVSYVHGSNNDRMRSSLSSWDLAPRGMGKITNDDAVISKREKDGSGFGKEVQQVVKGKRRKNRKVRK